jgi:thiol-disulfide isomerase/thioredoxin
MESSTGSNRIWLLVILGFVVAWMGYLALWGPRNRSLGPLEEGRQADFKWELKTLDGDKADLGTYKGKAIFLNIWATWCGPCVAEMPSIDRLAANPRLKDVAFLCISVDQSLESVQRFVKEHGLRMTVLWSSGPVPDAFATDGIPATFFIAPDGRIVRREIGSQEWDRTDAADVLEKLAKSASAGL